MQLVSSISFNATSLAVSSSNTSAALVKDLFVAIYSM